MDVTHIHTLATFRERFLFALWKRKWLSKDLNFIRKNEEKPQKVLIVAKEALQMLRALA